jgi:ERF superfamily protein
MPADGKGAKGGDVMTKTHATGSALTYGRRYLLALIFNLAIGELQDDDGNAAGHNHEPINAAQKEQIIALIKETASDTKALLRYVFPRSDIESVDQIPAWKFPDVIAALNAKAKAKAKEKGAKT